MPSGGFIGACRPSSVNTEGTYTYTLLFGPPLAMAASTGKLPEKSTVCPRPVVLTVSWTSKSLFGSACSPLVTGSTLNSWV
jgi:hypothetical protein